MPLQFFQNNEATAEAVAENYLQDNNSDQHEIGPHNHVANAVDHSIDNIGKLVGDLFLVGFSVHGDLLKV
jgi:hypothetical protein